MRRDSASSAFIPVLPMCGAVCSTICPAYDGIGERLLVPGHAGGEDDLAEGRPARAVGAPAVAGAVLEDEHGGLRRAEGAAKARS